RGPAFRRAPKRSESGAVLFEARCRRRNVPGCQSRRRSLLAGGVPDALDPRAEYVKPRMRGAGTLQGRASPILHHSVIDLAEPKRDDVERVILIEPPWPFRALLGQFRDGALHVAGGEIQRRQLSN